MFAADLPSLRPGTWLGGAVLLLVLLALLLAPWLAPADPAAQDILRRLAPPDPAHWLGTDQLGRDEWSRLLHGGRFSVGIAAASLGISLGLGIVLGLLAARAGGWVDEVLMRAVDALVAVPDVVVALFLVAILGPGPFTLLLALSAVSWTPFARLVRGLAAAIGDRSFVHAAELLNAPPVFIAFRHVLPHALRPVAAVALLRFGHKLVTVGGLSFLGLGLQPPAPDWGAMLAEARPHLERAPLLVLAPALAIFVTALAVTALGHGLEAAPRRSGLP